MKKSEYIFMALRDLWRRKGRTILTCLGITIGTLLIITLVGLGIGFNKFISDFVNSSVDSKTISMINIKYMTSDELNEVDPMTYMDDYYKKIDDNTVKAIEDTGKIDYIAPYLSYNSNSISIDNKKYKGMFQYFGYRDSDKAFSDESIESVREKEKDDDLQLIKYGKLNGKSGEVIVNEGFLKNLKLKPKDYLNKEITIIIDTINQAKLNETITKKVTIVGIINDKFVSNDVLIGNDEDVAYLKGASTLQSDYLKNRGYDGIDMLVKNMSDVKPVSNKIKDLGYYYQSAVDLAKSIDDKLGSISVGLGILGIVVLFVAAIGIVNTMSMSVMERTKSIGVMKAIGANSRTIKNIFLVQSSFIGLIGGGVGILLGSGINSAIQYFINNYISSKNLSMSISIGMPWYLVIGTLLFAMVISLVAGICPASRAAKLDPIEALRK